MRALKLSTKKKLAGTLCQIAGALGVAGALFFGADLLSHQAGYYATPERKECVRRLEGIAWAFRTWSLQKGDRFPFEVTTNQGGTMEFCARGPEGFDTNAFIHLQAASNELGPDPGILLCPADHSTKPARDYESLKPENVSFRLRTGAESPRTNELSPVLAICPVHGYLVLRSADTRVAEVATDRNWSAEVANHWHYDPEFRQGAKQVIASLAAAVFLILVGTVLKLKHQKAVP